MYQQALLHAYFFKQSKEGKNLVTLIRQWRETVTTKLRLGCHMQEPGCMYILIVFDQVAMSSYDSVESDWMVNNVQRPSWPVPLSLLLGVDASFEVIFHQFMPKACRSGLQHFLHKSDVDVSLVNVRSLLPPLQPSLR